MLLIYQLASLKPTHFVISMIKKVKSVNLFFMLKYFILSMFNMQRPL